MARMEAELRLEEKQQSAQEHLFKMQAESAAAMNQLLQTVLPKKSTLEKFWEQKAAITAMLAAGEITNEVASQLMEKLDTKLLNSHLI
jgi:6-phosphogluconate dehydrogenase (decarboxylating)